ncbi:MAG: hypothetical protein SVY53_04610 [Chloroflexota bacterium]|nr:hypothetical protein [Chloroflexota bacterium]
MREWLRTLAIIAIAVCVILILLDGITIDEAGMYNDNAVVEIEYSASEVTLNQDVTRQFDLTIIETTGKKVHISEIRWSLYDADGESLLGSSLLTDTQQVSERFLPPRIVEGEDNIPIDIKYEGDYTGDATLMFMAVGIDTTRGAEINSIPAYVDLRVT